MTRALLLLSLALGCGRPPCAPATCQGCCSADGQCVPGTSTDACGTGGASCQRCAGACGEGVCLEACAGCLRSGACVSGTSEFACGGDGGVCVACQAGEVCRAGRCEMPCGPTTCATCCEAGVCVPRLTTTRCGAGGSVCTACSTPQRCEAGRCVAPMTGGGDPGPVGGTGGGATSLPCSTATCSEGCCDDSNACRGGGEDEACGSFGRRCRRCTSQQRCDGASRLCVTN